MFSLLYALKCESPFSYEFLNFKHPSDKKKEEREEDGWKEEEEEGRSGERGGWQPPFQ